MSDSMFPFKKEQMDEVLNDLLGKNKQEEAPETEEQPTPDPALNPTYQSEVQAVQGRYKKKVNRLFHAGVGTVLFGLVSGAFPISQQNSLSSGLAPYTEKKKDLADAVAYEDMLHKGIKPEDTPKAAPFPKDAAGNFLALEAAQEYRKGLEMKVSDLENTQFVQEKLSAQTKYAWTIFGSLGIFGLGIYMVLASDSMYKYHLDKKKEDEIQKLKIKYGVP